MIRTPCAGPTFPEYISICIMNKLGVCHGLGVHTLQLTLLAEEEGGCQTFLGGDGMGTNGRSAWAG